MPREWQFAIKRALDIFFACLGLSALAPLLALFAIAVRFDSPGNPFFNVRVAGRGGSVFCQWKFRTMVKNARRQGHPFEIGPGDPRITHVGRFLRRWSLDELPQLWNILRGEMSLVGPRPAFAEVAAHYSESDSRRLQMRPGLTGLAQISGRNLLPWPDRIILDIAYIERYSLWMDFQILVRTIPVLLREEGVYGENGRVRMHDVA